MILAVDVYYSDLIGRSVGIKFDRHGLATKEITVDRSDIVDEYIPGEFYKRELPCLLKLIGKLDLNTIELIIIDGYIYVDNEWTYGLGAHLFRALNELVPVIGVAKNPLRNNENVVRKVFRGISTNPLYVSSIGFNLDDAVKLIQNLSGDFRIPDILKELDRLTKE